MTTLPHDNLEEMPRSAARIGFYVELARRVGGPVLELACGSGIVTLPVARTGLHVTGIDLAEPMLRHAQQKAATEGLQGVTRWVHGNAMHTQLEGDSRFRFVFITGNAFQAFLTTADQEEPWGSITNTAGQRVTVTGTQHFDTARQLTHWTTFRRWHDGTAQQRTTTRIACKFTLPAELDALLQHCGFEVTERHGDWDHSRFTAHSEHVISICRMAQRA